ncbi:MULTISPECIES: hypothetical protein [Agromyces]|uniref:Uncharacterized protein n=1 Tax=Agromyces indicus TaxID=758919 RepID=A0ABU1FGP5_9MICO|nr:MULTISPECIES: hypothetical protein [Agromyces]KZE94366.1 hypothetical protein AVP42_01013 [Agromyces sp. NDB4Y10]MCK8608172.1 hypothetical protein [Agromyces sp. C10]MDR5690927.1 hypothetical protein [Agromyces indicus]
MSDINTPRGGEHPQEPAEGFGEGGAPDERRHPDQPAEGGDEDTPPDDMSSYNIQPPPTEDGEVPGVPDASGALEGGTEDEPGANATGVGA